MISTQQIINIMSVAAANGDASTYDKFEKLLKAKSV